MSVYGALYRNVLFPLYERGLRGRRTLRYLDEMELSQWLPAEEVRARQWRKLQEMLAYSERHVPYYRRAFAEAGVRAAEIRAPEDLAGVPLLSKQAIRQNQDDLIALPFKGDRTLAPTTTSGSTGVPLKVVFSHDGYERRLAAWIRGDRWAGWNIGEKMFLIVGGAPIGKPKLSKEIRKKLHRFVTRQYVVTALHMSREIMMDYFRRMNRFRAPVLCGYANALYHFARFTRENNLKPHRPRSIIVTAEKIFEPQKRLLEEVFGAPVFERYGCIEFSFIAAECSLHKGMHLNCDNIYMEILDAQGRPVGPGETGEIVITCLYNYVMPFIRYRMGDLGRWAPGSCACGRGLPLIGEVMGRTLDMIVTPSGRICSGIALNWILDEYSHSIAQFQVEQKARDEITLLVVPAQGKDPQEDWEEIERGLRRFLGDDIRIRLETTDHIPASSAGKFRYVQSSIPIALGKSAGGDAQTY